MVEYATGDSPTRSAERGLIAVAGALLALCPYVTWIRVVLLGGIDLPGLLSMSGTPSVLAYLVTAVGVSLAIMALLLARIDVVRLVSLAVALVALFTGGPLVYQLIVAADATHGLAEIGVGLICGAVAAFVALIVPLVGLGKGEGSRSAPLARRPIPVWFPVSLGLVMVSALLLFPVRGAGSIYCGYPVASVFRSDRPMPSSAPPVAVSDQLSRDQAAVTQAQEALSAEEQRNAGVAAKLASADALSNQAQAAQQKADDTASTASVDENKVSSDQSALDSATSTVESDQSTLDADNSRIQSDQDALANDQQAGWDSSYDQQQLAADQSSLETDQQTLQNDRAAVQAAQDVLDGDSATQVREQAAATAAGKNAASAQQRATQAATSASQDDTAASLEHDRATQAVSAADDQLARDQNEWSSQHQSDVAAVTEVNANLASCRTQSRSRLITAALIALLAAAATGAIMNRAHRRRVGHAAAPDATFVGESASWISSNFGDSPPSDPEGHPPSASL